MHLEHEIINRILQNLKPIFDWYLRGMQELALTH